MMLCRCYNCHKIRKCGLPPDYMSDEKWMGRNIPIEWTCKVCFWENRAEKDDKTLEIITNKVYLMPYTQILPFLASIAVIIMICLIIAAHTL